MVAYRKRRIQATLAKSSRRRRNQAKLAPLVPPIADTISNGAQMHDRTAKLFAGQMGICAVLINILIDKGIVSEDELRERFEQARQAAEHSSGGPDCGAALSAMLEYLVGDVVRLDA